MNDGKRIIQALDDALHEYQEQQKKIYLSRILLMLNCPPLYANYYNVHKTVIRYCSMNPMFKTIFQLTTVNRLDMILTDELI